MNRNEEKKTALKLINKYAESYSLLEDENRSLRDEIKNLKTNLKINKEIIEDFYNNNNKDKNNFYLSKVKEENSKMVNQIEKLMKDKDEIRNKLAYIEQVSNETIQREKDENEKLKNKLFIIENAILKKENIIQGLKKKLEKFTENEDAKYLNYVEKEILVAEPTTAINQMHDELLLYKQIYDNLIAHVKENKNSLMKYENILNDVQNENAKLRTQIKLQSYNINKDELATYNMDKINNQITNMNKLKPQDNEKNQLDEWVEILRYSGLTPDELDRLGKNKIYSRVIESIEMLCRLLVDKNLQIRLLEQENDKLNTKNDNLYKANTTLIEQNLDYKKKLDKYLQIYGKTDDEESQNLGRITINNVNINSINAIQVDPKNSSKFSQSFEIKSESDTSGKKKENSSGHDSIIYTKDIKRFNLVNQIVNTIESCTSSEFRSEFQIYDESSFISRGNNDVQNLNIDIKDSNI